MVGSIRFLVTVLAKANGDPPLLCSCAKSANRLINLEGCTIEIIQKENNGIVCVAIRGRMGAELAPEFEKVIREIIRNDKRRILFDLGALEYLRSSALRVILNAVKEINQKRGKVVLCSLNGYVKEIFEVNCLKNRVPITESVESGIQELRSKRWLVEA